MIHRVLIWSVEKDSERKPACSPPIKLLIRSLMRSKIPLNSFVLTVLGSTKIRVPFFGILTIIPFVHFLSKGSYPRVIRTNGSSRSAKIIGTAKNNYAARPSSLAVLLRLSILMSVAVTTHFICMRRVFTGCGKVGNFFSCSSACMESRPLTTLTGPLKGLWPDASSLVIVYRSKKLLSGTVSAHLISSIINFLCHRRHYAELPRMWHSIRTRHIHHHWQRQPKHSFPFVYRSASIFGSRLDLLVPLCAMGDNLSSNAHQYCYFDYSRHRQSGQQNDSPLSG